MYYYLHRGLLLAYLNVSAGLFPDPISVNNIEVDIGVIVNLQSDLIPWTQCRVFAKEYDEILLKVIEDSLKHPRFLHIWGILSLYDSTKFPDVDGEHVDRDYKARILLNKKVNL